MRSKSGSRAIALCLALVGLMAVSVTAAQAETGASWEVNGKKITTLLPELLGFLEASTGTLLSKIGETAIHINCSGVTFLATSTLLAEGGWSGKVQFSGCKIGRLKAGAIEYMPACEPLGGIIQSVSGKGLIRLSGGSAVVVLEPSFGSILTTIATSEECAFGEKITISGKLGLRDFSFSTNQTSHLFLEHTITTELYLNGNKSNKATLDGSAIIELGWEHKGLKWSGKPA